MPKFRVSASHDVDTAAGDTFFLVYTGWDDWWKFSTLYNLYYVDQEGESHLIGGTKIGEVGLRPAGKLADREQGHRRPTVPDSFTQLDAQHFSLGQDVTFYENLSQFGDDFREAALGALNDIAYDPAALERAADEPVTAVSLLREVPLVTVKDQFARLARGGARLTAYNFGFTLGADVNEPLTFAVTPGSRPPTNIHVLIGRNGVGKSTLLNNLAMTMVRGSRASDEDGEPKPGPWTHLSNLVSVSFSAFDAFVPLSVPQDRTKGLTYHYVGLKKVGTKSDDSTAKDLGALAREITVSTRTCFAGARRARLYRALQLLEGDPVFAATGIADLIGLEPEDEVFERLPAIYKRLSSGHKIVLLTVTRLVETVEEKSMVLLDEPEAHLHPPLLSAFVRALSDLLTHRNGFAVVATHSPVVLQEVPRSCVWKLYRVGSTLRLSRPELETFGENVGTLTDEVFGLEVTGTGFHKMLTQAAYEANSYETALAAFDGQLGSEGRAVLRAMVEASERRSRVGS